MTGADGIAIAVLAAGASRRLGQPKQLLELNGRSLLDHALDQALQTGEQVYMVYADERLRACQQARAEPRLHCIHNPDRDTGMGSSIQVALRAIRAHQPGVQGVLFMPVDQPGLSSALLRRMIDCHRRTAAIVACAYEDTVGIPALFPGDCFPELDRIDPRRGAKPLLEKYADKLVTVPFAEGGRDIDTLADYRDWENKRG